MKKKERNTDHKKIRRLWKRWQEEVKPLVLCQTCSQPWRICPSLQRAFTLRELLPAFEEAANCTVLSTAFAGTVANDKEKQGLHHHKHWSFATIKENEKYISLCNTVSIKNYFYNDGRNLNCRISKLSSTAPFIVVSKIYFRCMLSAFQVEDRNSAKK